MTVTFLGTGTSQGVPVIGCPCQTCQSLDYRDKRLRTSLHIQTDERSFVVDTGPDFRQQMLRENIHRLDAVIFTHAHRDHTAGLDDVRAYNYLQQMDMPIYGTIETLGQLKTEYAYAFSPNSYPGIPRLDLHEISDAPFTIHGLTFTPLPVKHLNMDVLGYRIGDFSYITDANWLTPLALERLKGTETLVINALQKEKHVSHFNLSEALAQIESIGPRTAYLIHVSHRLGPHAGIQKELPPHVFLAYDGLQLRC